MEIVPSSPEPSLALRDSEEKQKFALIAEYLHKFAVVEGRAITDEQVRVFYEALCEYDVRKLKKGLARFLAKGTRFPWPGVLAAYIDEEV